MELRQLEYFVAVAEEANFTRAAERVRISQSGISAQIRALEREVGASLIDRSSRVASLTVAGKAALEHARAALASAESVQRSVDEVNLLVRGRLDVGMVTACTVTPLFDALAAFHHAHPGVEVSLAEGNSDVLIQRVLAGTLDVALVGTASDPPAELESFVLIREGLAVCVPPGHPLASRREVTVAEVCEHPVVCLPVGTGIRAVFDETCSRAGVDAHIALAASAPAAVADLAARGMGVGVLSRSMSADFSDRLEAVPISDVAVDAVLALVWSPNPSAAVRALTRLVSENV
ncbi:LysR family transcriptional regulator [Rhodococcoides kyotonense]|uniref:DNA-binding transcriptional regulator, LysR family n=1 Tax=Rhodococcoides kyotonense TaxID=398843 RepID=A0A239EZB1_9NOCA|nr:LysR family transcriptional regulator [Rhodococcus kyotonensis]SNS50006.1 DNA-binding transcriptional regulator, LysR family [Rhodococcus kyotonensis]